MTHYKASMMGMRHVSFPWLQQSVQPCTTLEIDWQTNKCWYMSIYCASGSLITSSIVCNMLLLAEKDLPLYRCCLASRKGHCLVYCLFLTKSMMLQITTLLSNITLLLMISPFRGQFCSLCTTPWKSWTKNFQTHVTVMNITDDK